MFSMRHTIYSAFLIAVFSFWQIQAQAQTPDIDQSADSSITAVFCYVIFGGETFPNTTIYAINREEADKQASKKFRGLEYCRRGPCIADGKLAPEEENCKFETPEKKDGESD